MEADARVCFFHLHGAPDSEFGVRPVWVRNLQPAPADLDVEGMKAGRPPMNPAAYCRSEDAASPADAKDLRVSWLPEVRDAALGGIERALGPRTSYYAIDGGHWPPRALVRIRSADRVVLVTAGWACCPSQAWAGHLRRSAIPAVAPALGTARTGGRHAGRIAVGLGKAARDALERGVANTSRSISGAYSMTRQTAQSPQPDSPPRAARSHCRPARARSAASCRR